MASLRSRLTLFSVRVDSFCSPFGQFRIEIFDNPAHLSAKVRALGIMPRHFDGLLPESIGDRAFVATALAQEGFGPILEQAKLADKFDIAIMSCKGMSVTAARQLIDRTCARYGIPLLILHDFDTSGFSIAKTLCSDTRRYSFRSAFETIDLGLRLTDVQELDLESEPVPFGRADPDKIRDRLERNGATDNEIAFLTEGQRVELNALTSDQFVAFVERKLTEAGIAKVVPSKDQLETAYRLFARSERFRTIVEKIAADADVEIAVPDDLEAQVRAYLAEHPDEPIERLLLRRLARVNDDRALCWRHIIRIAGTVA
jgi:hypothetical protein